MIMSKNISMTMNSHQLHQPVLLQEVIEALNINPTGIYIDATFGRGGHSQKILEKLTTGRLICLDKDPEAIAYGKKLLGHDERVSFYHLSFEELENFAKSANLIGKIDGILMDLGVSSPQIDEAQRGFSFNKEGPLDMRMNPETGISAKEWVNTATQDEIKWVLKHYGEEKFAGRIASFIVNLREQNPIETTLQLANIIKNAIPVYTPNKHAATKSFQAIRIYINQELTNLEKALVSAENLLSVNGILAIITFHSLEDRMVKKRFASKIERPDHRLPLTEDQIKIDFNVGKRKEPTKNEIETNPRSRSAKLRVLEKLRETEDC
jgi:16S rRNA (cytosine1402-N4)-methyltransferase